MIIVNPADLANPLVAGFGGVDVQLGGLVQEAAATVARSTWSPSMDPVAVALHFQAFVDAFLRDFLGYDKATRRYVRRRSDGTVLSTFGTMIAHHGTYETNCRGSLHMHALLWIRDIGVRLWTACLHLTVCATHY